MANLKESKGDIEQLSAVERIKHDSNGLYGPISAELGQDADHFSEESVQVLKHHGTYQQDNRDVRRERKKQGLDKLYTMMVRTKFPGGWLSGRQYQVCDDMSTKYGQGDIRITTRQGFQFHGVVKGHLWPIIHDLNTLGAMTTLGGCGDVVRNTMASPVADIDPRYAEAGQDLMALAKRISDHFLPRSTSYYDLWVDGEKVAVRDDGTVVHEKGKPEEPPDEPLYGRQYLPRKFKIGIGADFDNSVDLYTQDVGVMAVTDDAGHITGYEILAGGGLGFSHTKSETYPRAATPLSFVQHYDVVPICEAIVKVQRDFGERTNRKQARLKYTIDRMGFDTFRQKVEEYAGRSLDPSEGVQPTDQPDYLGWHKQIQPGLNYVGIWVENGRVKDIEGSWQYKTGLRAIIEKFLPDVRLTPHHNVILNNIADDHVDAVKAMMQQYNLPTHEDISPLRRWEMACPALPMCPLAQSESERMMPGLIMELEDAGYGGLDIMFRTTGCPNGCARSVVSEIGLVGKGPNRYILYTGGDYNGTRIGQELIPTLKHEDVVSTFGKLFDTWKAQREDGERFGDWAHRLGADRVREEAGIDIGKKKK
ncbi:MAG: NADPH-dependent assimilatory sulfite reductase hemoprotein subunit [Candidatus Hydrogenedentota bacterium]